MEVEENNCIAYLDAAIFRTQNSLIFDWFTKKTASNRLINFDSTHPRNQKINTAKNLIERVLKISDEQFHNKNIKYIYEILTQNGFPKNLIKDLIDTIHIKNTQDLNNTNKNKNDEQFFSVQYIPGLTDNKNIKEAIQQNNNKIAYKPTKTLNTIFTKVKAPIQNEQKNNVIYKIRCMGSEDRECEKIYIGTTKRNLSTRIAEHKISITKQKETTALTQHMVKFGHTADLDHVEILATEKIEKKRYIKESLYIQKNIEKTVNIKEDTKDINANYKLAIT